MNKEKRARNLRNAKVLLPSGSFRKKVALYNYVSIGSLLLAAITIMANVVVSINDNNLEKQMKVTELEYSTIKEYILKLSNQLAAVRNEYTLESLYGVFPNNVDNCRKAAILKNMKAELLSLREQYHRDKLFNRDYLYRTETAMSYLQEPFVGEEKKYDTDTSRILNEAVKEYNQCYEEWETIINAMKNDLHSGSIFE